MKKEDYVKALVDSGKDKEEMESLSVKDLKELYKELSGSVAEEGKLYQINSKRKDGSDEYWLYDCDEVIKWEDLDEKYFLKGKKGQLAPFHKAKDYAKKVNGKWELLFRDEVEKEEEEES